MVATKKAESKRIKAFRLSIAKMIPKFPNDKHSKQLLESASLEDLLIYYSNWAYRHIPPRQRKIVIEPTATNDKRWQFLKAGITTFLKKVKKGEDLAPHLSLEAHTAGFTPVALKPASSTDRWADKDFLLNIMGYHHFHLGLNKEKSGHIQRTDDLLFAHIGRDIFTAIALFDHSVFENPAANDPMNKERERLWTIFDNRTLAGVPAGSVIIRSPIMTSGHPMQLVMASIEHARIVREIDAKLDDPSFISSLRTDAGLTPPAKVKLRWHLNYLDLGLLDDISGTFMIFRFGPN